MEKGNIDCEQRTIDLGWGGGGVNFFFFIDDTDPSYACNAPSVLEFGFTLQVSNPTKNHLSFNRGEATHVGRMIRSFSNHSCRIEALDHPQLIWSHISCIHTNDLLHLWPILHFILPLPIHAFLMQLVKRGMFNVLFNTSFCQKLARNATREEYN